MGFRIFNDYSRNISAALMWYSPDTCPGDLQLFAVRGWWNIAPGRSALVHAADVSDINRYWYFHAHAADGSVWEGDWHYQCPNQAFSRCWGVNKSDGLDRGFAIVDVGDSDNYNLHLTP